MAASIAISIASTSCVDEIKFGSAFLEKAPGGTVGKDTVFSNAEYTRQFLTSIYALQYYGLPYSQAADKWPAINNPWVGKFDALSDCWQLHWNATAIFKQYYSGSHTAADGNNDKFSYNKNKVWEAVRAVWMLVENINNVPEIGSDERDKMKAEAYCLLAARYFDLFRHYGGLPLVTSTMEYSEGATYQLPRATVEETVKYMIKYLDMAINSGALPWSYEGSVGQNSTGRWTQAGAMALKCKILQFAASPLFNDTEPYYGGSSEAEQKLMVWYGGYKSDLWEQCRTACKDFFEAVDTKGFYTLNKATGTTPEAYRQAYRMGYVKQGSTEVIHSVRVISYEAFGKGAYYIWHNWCDIGRNTYTPTQEYVEMFPWSDGRPFDWNADKLDRDTMFIKGTFKGSNLVLQDLVLTRDPRLYESVRVNGLPKQLSWTSGEMNGNPYELWIGGYDAGNNPRTESGCFATGYDNMKYYLGEEYNRQYDQWVYLRLSDIMLTYAEALLQADNDFTGALKWVNEVRARVGLKKLEDCNPDKNLTSDKQTLLEEILRERACELGFEDSRFFDLIRYKMRATFEKPLHGLHIYRLKEGSTTETVEDKWFEGDRDKGVKQPTRFKYEKFVLNNRRRQWWDAGFDPKWYLSPFPQSEVNKNYGLVQNPGWR